MDGKKVKKSKKKTIRQVVVRRHVDDTVTVYRGSDGEQVFRVEKSMGGGGGVNVLY